MDLERLSYIMAKMSELHDLTHKLTKCLILIYYAFIMLDALGDCTGCPVGGKLSPNHCKLRLIAIALRKIGSALQINDCH